jgi:hypothetical protein
MRLEHRFQYGYIVILFVHDANTTKSSVDENVSEKAII